MGIKLEIIQQKEEITLAVRKTVSTADLPRTITEGYAKIHDYMVKNGIEMTAAPYAAYSDMNEDKWDIEMGFPVSKEFAGEGDVYAGKIPSAPRAASYKYKGSYSGIEAAYTAVFKQIEEDGLKPIGVCYDYYLNDPSVTPEDELLTQIIVPVE
ncbi:MAG: GyrI-like domain-containing protein [Chitinispirillales bacterium]|jgi:effector-binding domain-containing protein|nr:GyrI-like domain-containing protein [Chitinispirillales bacterium]